MRVPFALVLVAFTASPALALPHPVPAGPGINGPTVRIGTVVTGTQLEQRANNKRPMLKIEVKNVCESGKYTAIPNISGLQCSRLQPFAFLVGTRCYLPSERDFALMGPVEKGTCFVFKA